MHLEAQKNSHVLVSDKKENERSNQTHTKQTNEENSKLLFRTHFLKKLLLTIKTEKNGKNYLKRTWFFCIFNRSETLKIFNQKLTTDLSLIFCLLATEKFSNWRLGWVMNATARLK